MTCERRYDVTTVNLLQQAAATIEAERRRQYRAELADKLRALVDAQLPEGRYVGASRYTNGVVDGLLMVRSWIDELSPPIACDSSE